MRQWTASASCFSVSMTQAGDLGTLLCHSLGQSFDLFDKTIKSLQ